MGIIFLLKFSGLNITKFRKIAVGLNQKRDWRNSWFSGGGLYGGYAGGMGYPGMYDEDQSQSENQDETHDQGFADRIPVLIVPHHAVQRFLRRQGIDLDQSRRPAEMTQQIDNDLSNNQSAETREVVLQLPNRVIAKLLRKYGRGAC